MRSGTSVTTITEIAEMADFLSPGWSIFIAVVTIISVLACVALAWIVSTGRTPLNDDGTVAPTGHVWDEDLQELNNPLPRWWLYLFYITCVFGAAYFLLYPGLGSFSGVFGWTSGNQYEAEIQTADSVYEPLFAQHLATDIDTLATQPEALAMGERLFLTYCSQCHGSDARGGRSFPNLADNDWLGPGGGDYIKRTILNGRTGLMPPMAAAIGGTDADVQAVANYVLSLSGAGHDAALAETGAAKFAVCGGCHGLDGTGNAAVGAPNLTDDVWLHGSGVDSIVSAVQHGVDNQMPAFEALLGESKAHVLAAYVLSLSQTQGNDQ
jgi:cytochrome c oxidase cbb3-type subunit 3